MNKPKREKIITQEGIVKDVKFVFEYFNSEIELLNKKISLLKVVEKNEIVHAISKNGEYRVVKIYSDSFPNITYRLQKRSIVNWTDVIIEQEDTHERELVYWIRHYEMIVI
jgi:hypothetical protein